MTHTDFLVIGGGIIGMMTAYHLAEAGQTVDLLERGRCGEQASWAGGGIVSPLYPWQQSDAINRLAQASQSMYPMLAARLLATTGVDCEYRQRGLLYRAPEDGTAAHAWAARFAATLEEVDADFVATHEPHLEPLPGPALWMPALGSVRNPRLCRALRTALQRSKHVAVKENTAVEDIAATRRGVAVTAGAARHTADRAIVCSGAWTPGVLADTQMDLPITPVKGQMLLYRTAEHPDAPLLHSVVLQNGRYLIPRDDGRILVGSTLEPEAGFDTETTRAAAESLHETAVSMLPALAGCEIEQHWAGLRPGSPEGLPLIGAVPGTDGLYVNAGHYRNGIVLAPAATRLLVDDILGREPIVDPAPYRPRSRPRAEARGQVTTNETL